MTGLRDVHAFIEESSRLTDPAALESLMDSITRDMGFDFFALVHHVNLTGPSADRAVALSTYPSAWVEAYIARNIALDDPVHLASHRTNVGFEWGDVPKMIELTSAHRRITEETRRAGINDGYTVPANVPGEANGSCSFAVRTGRDLPRESLAVAQLVGAFAFQSARAMVLNRDGEVVRPRPKLTPRQLECVVLTGRGKTDWEISRILGIAEDTVTEYLDVARSRYGVSKRIQLVMRCIFDGHFAITDLLQ